MKAITAAAAAKVTELFARLDTYDTETAVKRTTDLVVFGQLLTKHLADTFGKQSRVYQINSPVRRGDIEVVIEYPAWTNLKAITYRADGTWSEPSYWCPGQI